MNLREQTHGRMYIVLTALALFPIAITAQLVWLNLAQGDHLRELGMQQAESQQILLPQRGEIIDIQGRPLVVNSPRYKLTLDPLSPGFEDQKTFFLVRLASLTGVSISELQTKIDERASHQFVRLVDLTPDQRQEVDSWNVAGVMINEHFQRQYVYKNTASHILGRMDVDGKGVAGLELEYDSYLSGVPGRRTLLRDRRGYLRVDAEGVVVDAVDGETLVLTIDLIRQTIMEEELAHGVAQSGAVQGSAIAVDPTTGAILAMANVPSYDPNTPMRSSVSSWRNRAVTDRLEPGSSFKLIAASAALETGMTSMDDIIDTGDGRYQVAGYTLNDIHEYGELTFKDVLAKSSNVGMALTTGDMPEETLYEYIRNFGFGQKTWIDLPGETSGYLKRTDRWSKTTKAALSIGYEIDVTPIQILMAFAALANDGLLRQPYIVAERRDVTGHLLWSAQNDPARTDSIRRVLSYETAQNLVSALTDVVQHGTATDAQLPHITIAGKTGTARKTVYGQYIDQYRATFVGFYPAENPQIAMIVILDEPQTSIYGGKVSAPIFRQIAQRWDVAFSTSTTPFPEKSWQLAVSNHDASTSASQSSIESSNIQQTLSMKLHKVQPSDDGMIMPNVVGLDARAAYYLLSSKGINVQFTGSGSVVEQTPESGEKATSAAVLHLQ